MTPPLDEREQLAWDRIRGHILAEPTRDERRLKLLFWALCGWHPIGLSFVPPYDLVRDLWNECAE